ncbi:tubulin-specific chaperone A [Suhomyces tanzawaensis NRRL Y-17324]|uniref:Tubulin-specific chaperone A n=1 Tax=Suhomyces tanzawaensis NRRL Y-17324 TaxID=984487 RepID=A0A1E4SKQ4_9ASCO|nr:tubulin-specific chaperone A [Suhomyces tanzawaensis NRRL Y-17324]ODV80070.1 tubulin-specific chaperone A [Suhomyces tanzawaensis NRRL Y-17324]
MSPTPLQIKINALKRLIKEESLYKQEVQEQEEYVNQMRSNKADEYELKKQVEVLEEAKRMVPEVTKKISQHREALRVFLDTYKGEEDVAAAKELLA